jgi:hypothetical protein
VLTVSKVTKVNKSANNSKILKNDKTFGGLTYHVFPAEYITIGSPINTVEFLEAIHGPAT